MKLKEYRKSLGMSRAEMARQLGVDIVTAWRWEAGYSLPIGALRKTIEQWSGGVVKADGWERPEAKS